MLLPPWASVFAVVRLVTNPRVFEHPEPIRDAWQQVGIWLTAETAWIPQPTERHAGLLGEFLALPGVHGNLVPDAHLAALAIEHGLTLCSTNGDFARFHGLRWVNPIAGAPTAPKKIHFGENNNNSDPKNSDKETKSPNAPIESGEDGSL